MTDEGRIEALEINCHANMGSWLSNFRIYIPTLSACRTMTGCYDIQAAGMSVKGVMTNTPAVDAYRGAGRPEANYVIERLMDHIAAELGLDRIVVRKTNMIKPEQIPYTLAAVGTIDSGDMPGLLEHALEKADWAGFAKRKEEAATRGRSSASARPCILNVLAAVPKPISSSPSKPTARWLSMPLSMTTVRGIARR